jgi:kynurenine formamidase
VDVAPGDILLLRTGWTSWYRRLDAAGRTRYVEEGHPECGLRPGRRTYELLWDLHVAAVGTDAPGIDVWPIGALSPPEEVDAFRADPASNPDIWLHYSAIALLGLVLGELFDLDALAEHCAREGQYEAFFVSAPMPVVGGVASPANPLAIV